MTNVTRFDQKRDDELLEQAAPEIRRRELFQLIGKPPDAFVRAQTIIEFALMYALGEQLYATAKRPECLDLGPNRLAFVRGAAQKALQYVDLPPALMFRLLAGVFYCDKGYSLKDSRIIARWAVCLEVTAEFESLVEMGYRFPEEQVPDLLKDWD